MSRRNHFVGRGSVSNAYYRAAPTGSGTIPAISVMLVSSRRNSRIPLPLVAAQNLRETNRDLFPQARKHAERSYRFHWNHPLACVMMKSDAAPPASARTEGFRLAQPLYSLHSSQKTAALALLIILLNGCGSARSDFSPSIEFSRVPRSDEGGTESQAFIEGRVDGVRAGQQIVLFAKTGAGVWWVQPFAAQPFTTIRSDLQWRNSTLARLFSTGTSITTPRAHSSANASA